MCVFIGAAEATENTLPAFRNAVRCGSELLELGKFHKQSPPDHCGFLLKWPRVQYKPVVKPLLGKGDVAERLRVVADVHITADKQVVVVVCYSQPLLARALSFAFCPFFATFCPFLV